ncbi:uncharacterized protein [Narcine bancroftii]|uniref:uncharacterized protein isoform X2 n=1 Tax=Narcine bancroftii TaxID=1343680 RepID=UPI0038319369
MDVPCSTCFPSLFVLLWVPGVLQEVCRTLRPEGTDTMATPDPIRGRPAGIFHEIMKTVDHSKESKALHDLHLKTLSEIFGKDSSSPTLDFRIYHMDALKTDNSAGEENPDRFQRNLDGPSEARNVDDVPSPPSEAGRLAGALPAVSQCDFTSVFHSAWCGKDLALHLCSGSRTSRFADERRREMAVSGYGDQVISCGDSPEIPLGISSGDRVTRLYRQSRSHREGCRLLHSEKSEVQTRARTGKASEKFRRHLPTAERSPDLLSGVCCKIK